MEGGEESPHQSGMHWDDYKGIEQISEAIDEDVTLVGVVLRQGQTIFFDTLVTRLKPKDAVHASKVNKPLRPTSQTSTV